MIMNGILGGLISFFQEGNRCWLRALGFLLFLCILLMHFFLLFFLPLCMRVSWPPNSPFCSITFVFAAAAAASAAAAAVVGVAAAAVVAVIVVVVSKLLQNC